MTLYVVRHAEAGPAPDEVRPLNDAGRAQAAAIAARLAPAGVARILTSRYARCRETVASLAEQVGVEPEEHDALGEDAAVERAWALLETLANEDAVVCSHGNIISPVLDRVRRRGAVIEAHEWVCRKGSVWRLEPDADGRFVRAVLELSPTPGPMTF